MSGWTLIDRDQVLDLGDNADEVEKNVLAALIQGKLSSPNAIADLISPSGRVLSVGILGGDAYVEITESDWEPPFLRVLRQDHLASGSDNLAFQYKGEKTEIPRKNSVDIETMKNIVSYFLRHESPPEWVEWEEV